jgi:hypothetical protein
MTLLRTAALAAFLLALAQAGSAAETAAPKTLVFNFYFDNTSPEAILPAETARINAISDALRKALQNSKHYEVISGSATPLTSLPNYSTCTNDQRAAAQKAGAALAVCGWVQKVSNLILNLNLVIEDVKTGKTLRGGSVDIRGNTDESWDRGLRYLLEEHVFGEH